MTLGLLAERQYVAAEGDYVVGKKPTVFPFAAIFESEPPGGAVIRPWY